MPMLVLSVIPESASTLIVPMLRVGMHPVTLRVTLIWSTDSGHCYRSYAAIFS